MAKVAAVDFVSNTAACATSALAEELGLPMGITLLLSFATGVTVGQFGNKLVFKNVDNIVLGEIDTDDLPELKNIPELESIPEPESISVGKVAGEVDVGKPVAGEIEGGNSSKIDYDLLK